MMFGFQRCLHLGGQNLRDLILLIDEQKSIHNVFAYFQKEGKLKCSIIQKVWLLCVAGKK